MQLAIAICEFLTAEEAAETSVDTLWYKVKEILQYPDLKAINRLILSNDWIANDVITDNIVKLFEQIKCEEFCVVKRYDPKSLKIIKIWLYMRLEALERSRRRSAKASKRGAALKPPASP